MGTKARHRATKYKPPLEWRIRRYRNKWHAFIKPALRTRLAVARNLVRQFIIK